jgi:hypothetical protein
MAPALSANDMAIIGVGVGLTTAYIFREQLFGGQKSGSVPTITSKGKALADQGDPRDFVAKMIANVRPTSIIFILI